MEENQQDSLPITIYEGAIRLHKEVYKGLIVHLHNVLFTMWLWALMPEYFLNGQHVRICR